MRQKNTHSQRGQGITIIENVRSIVDKIWEIRVRLTTPHIRSEAGLHIVTGADTSHARALENLLISIRQNEPTAAVTAWDLGLQPSERAQLVEEFPEVQFRDFPYQNFPSFMQITKNAGQYAWKPWAIKLSLRQEFPITLWLDAGNLLISSLELASRMIAHKGFFSPYAAGTIQEWTHPQTLNFLKATAIVSKGANCNGAIVGFDSENQKALKLLDSWTQCALNRDCIAPQGSNRSNHRQDQAALSVLAQRQGLNRRRFDRELRRSLGILTHQDPE